MSKKSLKRFRSLIVCVLVFFVGTTSGCESFRRKFIRKKKNADAYSQGDVIFDPVDYPDPVKSPLDNYRQYYALWKVWVSDLALAVEDNASEKKVRYTLGKIKEQILAMRQLLKQPVPAQMDLSLAEVESLNLEFEKSSAFRNKAGILSRIQKFRRDFRDHFEPARVAESLNVP